MRAMRFGFSLGIGDNPTRNGGVRGARHPAARLWRINVGWVVCSRSDDRFWIPRLLF
jgi:hypothetical protein